MNRIEKSRLNNKAFTLAEVLIVVAIVIVLAGVSVPIIISMSRKAQERRIYELELSAEAAAVSAFYAGKDSNGQPVNIKENYFCTFLYDAENNAVYVLNMNASGAGEFKTKYPISLQGKIEKYGSDLNGSINNRNNKLIIIKFDARYIDKKGSFEQPKITVSWVNADASFFS